MSQTPPQAIEEKRSFSAVEPGAAGQAAEGRQQDLRSVLRQAGLDKVVPDHAERERAQRIHKGQPARRDDHARAAGDEEQG